MKLIIILFTALAFPHPGSSQDSFTNELQFEVNRVYPSIVMTKEKLCEAQTLIDLNPHYKPSWIREFISVEVLTISNGKTKSVLGKNDILSQEQKDIMYMADEGTGIEVRVRYIPDNTLKHNDVKEFDFKFTVNPESDAAFPGGEQKLKQYLKEMAIDKIPESSFKDYDLATVKFTVNEEGHIINAHVFWPSKDKKAEELLLEAIRNMPSWKPAEYANGLRVKQEFAFTVGNHENCVINLLNVRRDL